METERKIITSEVRLAFQSKCDEMREKHKRQVHVSHLGTFSQDLVMSLSQDIEDLLVSIGGNRLVIKRMFSILIEGLQNVRIHGEADPVSNQQLGYLILASSEKNYKIIMANITTVDDKEKISGFIEKINNYSSAELKDTYRSVLSNEFLSQKGGAGLGFITTRMKSGNSLGIEFSELNDEYVLFSLEVTLDRIPKD